ncbi:MAG TPA: mechanosensitive ion channel family protein [Pyrinomonadaceae bacterium]|nr:mechanosensitive ion channel family protein [Pyrinomonadaceae bacterium]
MRRPSLRKQLLFPALLAALFALVYYALRPFSPPAPPEDAPEDLRNTFAAYWWVLNTLFVLAWLAATFVIVRLAGELVFHVFRRRKGQDAPRLVRDLFALVAYTLLIVFVLKYFYPNLSLGALLPTSALLGVILGLALQETLGNLFAGVSLHADKPFQVGDVITVGTWTGVVEGITWRAVKVRTFQNHIVLFSNSSLSKESIVVCPRTNANARLVFFSAEYTDSPVKVISAVREAVRECENVLRYMTPNVRIRNLGDYGVEYEVKYWLKDYAQYNDTDALVRQRILYAFRRAGLSFAYPTHVVHVERDGADAAAPDFEHITERLAAVGIFSPLTRAELATLAENATSRVFAPGEIIIREGDPGSSMFVVHGGSVEVRVEQNGQARTVSTLREGDFFGEMALFTGEPRAANVVAAEETEVLEIGREAAEHLFDTNPDLVEALSRTIAQRRAQLDERPADEHETERAASGLLASIRRFFRLN